MTYAESRNAAPFDWNAFLNKETFTKAELANAEWLAASWITDAVGNQSEVIPRNKHGFPEDSELWDLGVQFADDIEILSLQFIGTPQHFLEAKTIAKNTLHGIEARSAYLIQKINENK